MRILSVVTLVSPDAAYGGPLRVAVNQAAELSRRGHELTLVAAHRGFERGTEPSQIDGVPLQLFPAVHAVPGTGFAGLCAPAMLTHLRKQASEADLVHVHLARDLVTLPAATLLRHLRVPFVVQSHGMLDASTHPLARLLDPVLTVPVLRAARATLVLTDRERADLLSVAPDLNRVVEVPNGVPRTDLCADTTTPEVLYLARLAPRKRPRLMVELADALVEEFPGHRFRLVGPDEGEARAVQAGAAVSKGDVAWEGPLAPEETVTRMSRAGVYVLPAVDEPYPMSVLEAMSVGLPVVVTRSCGLASVVARTGAGVVTDPSVEGLADGLRHVLADPARAADMGAAGRRAAGGELGMAGVVDTLEQVYVTAAAPPSAAGGRAAGTPA